MKEPNRKVLVCDVQSSEGTGEDSVRGDSALAGELTKANLAETKAALDQRGWKHVGQCKIYNGRAVDVWQEAATEKRIAVWEYVRWMIWVDLEGFGHLYRAGEDNKALWALRGLMRDLFRVGKELYPGEGERLFIHQVGDGFIVEPDFGDVDLLRPLAIGIALHRAALLRGSCLKVGIGLGTLADVQGCYPEEIMNEQQDGAIRIGAGLMTVFPVMGDGLVDAHAVSEKASGPLLLVRGDLADALPKEGASIIQYSSHFEVDWIHVGLAEVASILKTLGLNPTSEQLEEKLREYLDSYGSIRNEWRKSAELLLRGY